MPIEISFRTLKGATFRVIARESETILDLKRKVASNQKIDDYAEYELIYKGKILQDDTRILYSSITSSSFVLVVHPTGPPVKQCVKRVASEHCDTTAVTLLADPGVRKGLDTKPDPLIASKEKYSSIPSLDLSEVELARLVSGLQLNVGATFDTDCSAAASKHFVNPISRSRCLGEQIEGTSQAPFDNPGRGVESEARNVCKTQEAGTFSTIRAVPNVSSTCSERTGTTDSGIVAQNAGIKASTGGDASWCIEDSSRCCTNRLGVTPLNMFPFSSSTSTEGVRESGNVVGSHRPPRRVVLSPQIRHYLWTFRTNLSQVLEELESDYPDMVASNRTNSLELMQLINDPLREAAEVREMARNRLIQALAIRYLDPHEVRCDDFTKYYATYEEEAQISRLKWLARSIGVAQGYAIFAWYLCNNGEFSAANFLYRNADELRASQRGGSRNSHARMVPHVAAEDGKSSRM